MQLSISIVETSVDLGKPVTVKFNVIGSDSTFIVADCLANPINLGGGDQTGTIKLLPVQDGTFTVSITGGFGEQDSNGGFSRQDTKTATVQVK